MPQTPEAKTAGKEYRYVGDHAVELQVGDTLPWVGHGDFITLSGTDANNEKTKALIEEGLLVDVVQATQQAEEAATAAEEAAAAQERAEEMAEGAGTPTPDRKGGK